MENRKELEKALLSADENTICAYFNRGELWSSKVSPVLLAVGTLRVMMRSSSIAHWECYSQAVQLLEYIHSECPQIAGKEYYDLLIEVKTKVVLCELFQEVTITDDLKESVLTKYLGEKPKEPVQSCDAMDDYAVAMHAYARESIENMPVSDERSLVTTRNFLFNTDTTRMINDNLLSNMNSYLDAVCKELVPAISLQQPQERDVSAFDEDPHPEAGASDTLHSKPNSSTSEEEKNGSDVYVLRSGRVRLVRTRSGQNRQTQSETSTTATSEDEDEDDVLVQLGYNQKQQRGRLRGRGRRSLTSESESDSEDQDRAVEKRPRRSERNKKLLGHTRKEDNSNSRRNVPEGHEGIGNVGSESESNGEDQDRAVERGPRRSERTKKLRGHTSQEDDSDSRRNIADGRNRGTERVQRSVSTRYSEPPPTPSGVKNTAQRGIADVSMYATPPRMSRRLALKRHEDIGNVGLSWSNFSKSKPQIALTKIEVQKGTRTCTSSSSEAKQVKRKVLGMETVSNVGCPPLLDKPYQLRQRVTPRSTGGLNTRSSSRDTGVSEAEGTKLMVVRTAGRKRKKVSTSLSTGSSSSSENKLSARPRQGKPKRKRHILVYESSDSSSEKGDEGWHKGPSTRQKTKRQAQLPEIKSQNITPQKSRRKQATPRKYHNLGQKLESKVHFSQTSDTQSGSEPDSNAVPLSRLRNRMTRVRQGSSDTEAEDSDSGTSEDSEYEPSTPRRKSRTRPQRQPPSTSSAVTSGHRAVNLAGSLREQSQPGSQWEYVAVQTVAARDQTRPSHSPQKVGRERFRGRRGRASETESDYGHVSVVSSEEVALITGQKGRRRDGDKLCRVSESSSSPVSLQPALQSIHNLRKRAL